MTEPSAPARGVASFGGRARAGLLYAWCAGVLGLVACSSAPSVPSPPLLTGGSAGSLGSGGRPSGGAGGRAAAGGATAASSGTAGESGAGGASGASEGGGDSGAPAVGEAGAAGAAPIGPSDTPTACPDASAWGTGIRLAISSSGDDQAPSTAADELTLVFVSGAKLYYAERSQLADDFGAAVALSGTDFVQATLSADGLRVVGTRAGGRAFAELTRPSRDVPFDGTASEDAFQAINQTVAGSPLNGSIADPLLSPNDDALLFSFFALDPDGTITLREASGPPWGFGRALEGAILTAQGTARRIATGLSGDLRTLFYWDEVSQVERAVARATPGAPFERAQSLGDRRGATPNPSCDRLYYAARGPHGDLDLFVAEAK